MHGSRHKLATRMGLSCQKTMYRIYQKKGHINKEKAGYETDISVEPKSISTLSVHPVGTESPSKIIERLNVSFHRTTLIRSALLTYIQSDKSLRNSEASAYIWGSLTCHCSWFWKRSRSGLKMPFPF